MKTVFYVVNLLDNKETKEKKTKASKQYESQLHLLKECLRMVPRYYESLKRKCMEEHHDNQLKGVLKYAQ